MEGNVQTPEGLENASFESFLKTLYFLPAISPSSEKVFALMDDPNVSISMIAGLIEEDPGLASRLMTVANSPFYPFPEKVASIRGALVRLGLLTVRGVLLTTSLFDRIKSQRGVFELWKHSLGVSHLARSLSQYVDGGLSTDEANLAGLLHDIGKIPFQMFDGQRMQRIIGREPVETSDIEQEKRDFGISHDQVGYRLLTQWKFPLAIREAIRWQHHPSGAPAAQRKASALIGLADLVCRGFGIGHMDFPYLDAPLGESMEILGISPAVLLPIMVEFVENESVLESASQELF